MAMLLQAKGHLVAMCTILLWSLTFIVTKVLLDEFTPLEVLFFRFLIGYITLIFFAPRMLYTTGWRQEIIFMFAGFFGVTLYFLLENVALSYTFASNVGIIVAIAPFCTALLAAIFLRGKGYDDERLTWLFFVGFVLAISGIILIFINGSVHLNIHPLGDILAVCAAVAWAFYSICMRKIGEMGYTMLLSTRRVFFYGLLFMLPVVALQGISLDMTRFAAPAVWGNFLFLGVLASAICFATWSWSVKVLGAVKASAYIYLMPVMTTLEAAIILDEHITSLAMLGIALTLVGLILSEIKTLRMSKKGDADE